jgi:peptidoglycan/xylan/chitin deacetylase (PgdA/CDA1 family)
VLNFKNTNRVFIASALLILGANFFVDIPFWFYLALAFIYSLILFYGAYFVHSNFYIPVVCRAHTDKKEIALTFDDGPHEINTLLVLETLKQKNVAAAFFCIGKCIKDNQDLVKKIDAEGHLIGNHSYSHDFWFDLFPADAMIDELKETDDTVERIIHKTPRFFRPPYGVTNPMLAKAIRARNYVPIGWNVRTMDTVIKDDQKLLTKISGNIRPGDIFLFHDTQDVTVKALPAFINTVHEQGFKIVRLDKLLMTEAYA